MTERTFSGKLVNDKDGFEVTDSSVFSQLHFCMGYRGEEFVMSRSEAEALAKWILNISPYGNKMIT